MAYGIPVRLSEALTVRAREAARALDRSLTEQVEHWARLGQIVEATISSRAVERLKANSHDADLAQRLAFAGTREGRAKAAQVIRARNAVRHGVDRDGKAVVVARGVRRATRRAKRPKA